MAYVKNVGKNNNKGNTNKNSSNSNKNTNKEKVIVNELKKESITKNDVNTEIEEETTKQKRLKENLNCLIIGIFKGILRFKLILSFILIFFIGKLYLGYSNQNYFTLDMLYHSNKSEINTITEGISGDITLTIDSEHALKFRHLLIRTGRYDEFTSYPTYDNGIMIMNSIMNEYNPKNGNENKDLYVYLSASYFYDYLNEDLFVKLDEINKQDLEVNDTNEYQENVDTTGELELESYDNSNRVKEDNTPDSNIIYEDTSNTNTSSNTNGESFVDDVYIDENGEAEFARDLNGDGRTVDESAYIVNKYYSNKK